MMTYNIVAYGSLIHPDTWPESCNKCVKVKISGYERRCNHEKVYPKDDNRGVFNIVEKSNSKINGVLLQGIKEKDWKDIIYRERGYGLIDIQKDKIIINNDENKPEDIKIFMGLRGKDNIKSDRDYVKHCIEGSKKLGDKFAEEFLKTSYIYMGDNRKLLTKVNLEEYY